MAKVQVQLLGGELQHKEADTVGELIKALDIPSTHEAFVNGEAVTGDECLSDYDYVSFAKKQEGASRFSEAEVGA